MAAIRRLAVFLFLWCGCASAGEDASRYPSRPVEIIVSYAAGGGMDVSSRLVAKYAEPELGQPLVVVNKPRGGNTEGNIAGVAAAPDGYTLLTWGIGLVTDELILKNIPYGYRDVRPVCMFANAPEVIVVQAEYAREHGIATLDDLFAHVAGNPGKVTIGMGGNWTTHDFLRLKMESRAGISFNRMPFLGGAPALKATAQGNCIVAVPFISELLPYLESGEILPLAVAFDRRVPQLPGVPSTAELGYPEIVQTIWRVLTVPKDTPDAIVARLEEAFRHALGNPELRREADSLGISPAFMPARETEAFIEREYRFYAEKTEEWGIRIR